MRAEQQYGDSSFISYPYLMDAEYDAINSAIQSAIRAALDAMDMPTYTRCDIMCNDCGVFSVRITVRDLATNETLAVAPLTFDTACLLYTSMGFGDTVSAYVWDSMGGRVFSIGGSGEISIHQYDFNVPTESKRHTVVDRKGVDEGSLAFFDGELYFCETTLEGGGMIYRIKPEGGTRRSYMEGSAFALSGDGRYMAFSASGDDALGGGETHFGIRDMHNGALTTITDEFSVYTFLWSYDGSRLYYIENRLSGSAGEETESTGDANDAYPYRRCV